MLTDNVGPLASPQTFKTQQKRVIIQRWLPDTVWLADMEEDIWLDTDNSLTRIYESSRDRKSENMQMTNTFGSLCIKWKGTFVFLKKKYLCIKHTCNMWIFFCVIEKCFTFWILLHIHSYCLKSFLKWSPCHWNSAGWRLMFSPPLYISSFHQFGV